jgi:hypothetical protein
VAYEALRRERRQGVADRRGRDVEDARELSGSRRLPAPLQQEQEQPGLQRRQPRGAARAAQQAVEPRREPLDGRDDARVEVPGALAALTASQSCEAVGCDILRVLRRVASRLVEELALQPTSR